MRLFEQFGASEFVLKAADAALSVAEEDDESLVRTMQLEPRPPLIFYWHLGVLK